MTTVEVSCINVKCGLPFAVPAYVERQARNDNRRSIWCPSCGSSFVYSESTADKLAREKANLQASYDGLQSVRSRLEDQVAALKRTVACWKGIAHRRPRS